MPVDDLVWYYEVLLHDTIEFEGSTSFVFENVTQSQTLLSLSEETPLTQAVLQANAGDVMRITSMLSGSGETQGGATREYHPSFGMLFMVPEPDTVCLLLLAAHASTARKRRVSVRAG